MTLTLILPRPPSANMYWRPVTLPGKNGAKGHVTIVPTKEAKAYRAEVAALCQAAGLRGMLEGRLEMQVLLYPHRPLDWQTRQRKLGPLWDDTVQSIDLGNCEKILGDALQGVAYHNDKQLWDISLKRREPDAGGERVVVVIRAMPTLELQTALPLPAPPPPPPPPKVDPFAEAEAEAAAIIANRSAHARA